mmetsp:Transcript_6365/g.20289  ORF Transcript_6365/g.20289 Transcript_6365/m.20289 type:complete len:293 (-) Transcript_6365:580-1458(-)
MLDDLPPRSHGGLRDADLVAEAVEHRCGEAAPAEPLDGWQPRVVPAADEAALDEELELALRHERVRDVEARVLPRHGLVQPQGVQQPVVRPVDRLALPELEGAERVRDVLERVDDAVGVVVGRVDAPLVAGARVRVEEDAVRRRVPERRVVRQQVALHPEHGLALAEPARPHPLEEEQVLLHTPAAERRARGRRQRRRRLAGRLGLELDLAVVVAQRHPRRLDLFGGLVADVGAVGADQLQRQVVELREVVRAVRDRDGRVAEPRHRVEDRVNVLLLLRRRVGVVKPHHRRA